MLPLEDVLYRLDFEESETVEREIATLLFTCIFGQEMSNQNRYKALAQMNNINRNACLDLHRLIYTCKIADTKLIISHATYILTVCLRMLQTVESKQDDLMEQRSSQYDFELQSQQSDETSIDENSPIKALDVLNQCKSIKQILLFVLFSD